MSQKAARQQTPAKAEDEEEVANPRPIRPAHSESIHPRHPIGQPPDGGDDPDEASEPEFPLTGDNDLSPADLGPAAPNTPDPDVAAERIRKIPR